MSGQDRGAEGGKPARPPAAGPAQDDAQDAAHDAAQDSAPDDARWTMPTGAPPRQRWPAAEEVDLPEVAMPRLSARMDAEVRAQRAEDERMAMTAQLRSRDLAAVARELMVRGDEIEVRLREGWMRGVVTHAAGDLMVIDSASGPTVDVRLAGALVVRVIRQVRSGGRPPGRGAGSFTARLREHELAAAALEVALTDGGGVSGTLEAVAADHLLLASPRGRCVIARDAVQAVWLSPVGAPDAARVRR